MKLQTPAKTYAHRNPMMVFCRVQGHWNRSDDGQSVWVPEKWELHKVEFVSRDSSPMSRLVSYHASEQEAERKARHMLFGEDASWSNEED